MDTQKMRSAAFSASARSTEVPVPREVLAAAGIKPGQPVVTIPLGDGEFVFATGEADPGFAEHGGARFGPAKLKKAGLSPGQPLSFTVLENGAVRAAPITDVRADPAFINPPLDADGRPVPPGWLIQAFTSVPSVTQHIRGGDRGAGHIAAAVRELGQDIADYERILDFGCGVGRILRGLPKHTKAKLTGCDLHEDAIAWLTRHMPEHEFMTGTEYPPLEQGDDSFDLIYAISVLTHLDEAHQKKWLEEWARILKPGGVAIVTFRDEEFINKFVNVESVSSRLLTGLEDNGGFLFESHQRWQGVFSSFYADAYHSKDYIKRVWGEHFDIVAFKDPGEFITRQNAAILRKPVR